MEDEVTFTESTVSMLTLRRRPVLPSRRRMLSQNLSRPFGHRKMNGYFPAPGWNFSWKVSTSVGPVNARMSYRRPLMQGLSTSLRSTHRASKTPVGGGGGSSASLTLSHGVK